MTGLDTLWLPLLLSSVIVFIASSIIHMLTPWHKTDFSRAVNQDAVMDALRPLNIPPGDYGFPCPTEQEGMSSPAFAERMKKGPVVVMTVVPSGPMNMGRNLGLWFVYIMVVGFFAAYIASRALAPGVHYLRVFRFIGASAFMGYSLGLWQMVVWYHRSWTTTIKSSIDGLIYACLTAGTFGWLWPK